MNLDKIRNICIYKNVLEDTVVRNLLSLLEGHNDKMECYKKFIYLLLDKKKNLNFSTYLEELIMEDENPFVKIINSNIDINEELINNIKNEILTLLQLGRISREELRMELGKVDIVEISESIYSDTVEERAEKIFNTLMTKGGGLYGAYSFFKWKSGKLYGIDKTDKITLNNLFKYEYQRDIIIRNTEDFLKGYKANNILLYGTRGTGKSATVKAIINEYKEMGLKIIEVNKEDLGDLETIIKEVSDLKFKFIIFVDDLVFGQGDSGYSSLKTILEGGISERPENILIYATSNRRHLVVEKFSEREDEVFGSDAIEEKISLADRFGITISFMAPTPKEYLEIVYGILNSKNIQYEEEYIKSEANKWQMSQNGRSGRTAKQFVDYIIPKLRED